MTLKIEAFPYLNESKKLTSRHNETRLLSTNACNKQPACENTSKNFSAG